MSDGSDKIDRFRRAFERGEKGQVDDEDAWLREQGFLPERVNDEWVAQYFRENPTEAVDQTEELETVAEYLGVLSEAGGVMHLPVVGVSGIGKTVFLQTIQQAVEELPREIPVRLVDADAFDEETADGRFQLRVLQDDLRQLDEVVLLIDNCNRDREIDASLRAIGECVESAVVVSAWPPEWWRHRCDDVESVLQVTNRIHLEPFNQRELAEVVRKLIAVMSDGEVTPSEEFVSAVETYSFGIPRVAALLVRKSITQAFRSGEEIGPGVVEETAAALELPGMEETVYAVPDARVDVLNWMLLDTDPRGMQPSKLVDLLNRDKSTVSYHLRELRDAGIVESERAGRRAFYRIREPVRPLVQDRIIRTGEING